MTPSNCPGCGAPIHFKSRFSTTAICAFCQSMLLREGNALSFNGKMAHLAEDMSVFQIGTQGSHSNMPFEIIGQIKMDWSEGYWNEWYVIQENGVQAWIAEAMGFISYINEISPPNNLMEPHTYQLGSRICLNDIDFKVSDIKSCSVAGCMGELPLEVKPGLKGISLDLRSGGEHCAYLEYYDHTYRVFIGKEATFEELNLTNLRVLDGW